MATDLGSDPHRDQPVFAEWRAGAPLGEAGAGMLMLHGRGASAQDVLSLAQAIERPRCVYLAPQAAGSAWYPYPFMAPIEQNEPWLSSALEKVNAVLVQFEQGGIPAERVVLLGFSQGACLALEYTRRHPRRYGGVVGLSGGLIGPAGTPWESTDSLQGTPVFLGCSDADPHIPLRRVRESASVLREMGGEVTERIYPGMGHTVNLDEIEQVRAMLDRLDASREIPE